MNKINLVGRLAADPKFTKYKADVAAGLPNDKCRFVVYFELAVERSSKKEGSDKQKVDWIPVSFFHGQAAKFIRDYIRRGDIVAITGKLETSVYEQPDGIKKKNIRVIGSEIDNLTKIRKDRKKRESA